MPMRRKLLLVCGVLSSLLYVAIDVLAAIVYPAYHSFTAQAISELMARGAPTERLVDPLFLLYDVLLIAFGVGVWMSPGPERARRISAALLVVNGALGFLGPTLFEMNMRGTAGGQGDVPHIILTGVLVIVILATIGVGAVANGRAFRRYSFVTLLAVVVTGALTGLQARHLAAGEPTPWFGALERLNIGAYLLWVAVLAVSQLRRLAHEAPGRTNGGSLKLEGAR
jgi:hypothetical protein